MFKIFKKKEVKGDREAEQLLKVACIADQVKDEIEFARHSNNDEIKVALLEHACKSIGECQTMLCAIRKGA